MTLCITIAIILAMLISGVSYFIGVNSERVITDNYASLWNDAEERYEKLYEKYIETKNEMEGNDHDGSSNTRS